MFWFNKLIRLAVKNMNRIRSQKYGYAPNGIEEKVLESKQFWEIYDFDRLVKVKEHAEWYECADIKKDKVLFRKLKEPLKVGEKVLALSQRIKKKDAPRNLLNSTTEIISVFRGEQLFEVRKIIRISDINYYWISKEGDDKIINKRFLRQELYALNDQFS